MALEALYMFIRCKTCGFTGRTNVFGASGNSSFSITGVTTRCPRCGSLAEVVDGTYQFRNGILSKITGLSKQDAEAVLSILRKYRNTDLQDEQSRKKLLNEVDEVAPAASGVLAELLSGNYSFVSMLIGLVALLVAINGLVEQKSQSELDTAHYGKVEALFERMASQLEEQSETLDNILGEVDHLSKGVDGANEKVAKKEPQEKLPHAKTPSQPPLQATEVLSHHKMKNGKRRTRREKRRTTRSNSCEE